ncbi:quinol oxidase [Acidisarcina polymorpha]|uniref:Quinol oxidase n=1 Tax=Acidisarcina polymorpha TaxID=2211140 RepID=A0A2Z5FX16_9BACT|nr:cupredoxin domain-containing protein [Acidisarcina polymorpha]AXC11260.1 quinol oxidase [Acidisarcina polymorpha]
MKLKFVLLSGFVVALAASLLLVHSTHAQAAPRRIEITAKRFDYTPGDITLKKGEPVVLVLKSDDVTHGLRFKDLGLNIKITKGQTTEVPFTPDKTGDFVGQCSVFCGSGHGSMKMTVHVVG